MHIRLSQQALPLCHNFGHASFSPGGGIGRRSGLKKFIYPRKTSSSARLRKGQKSVLRNVGKPPKTHRPKTSEFNWNSIGRVSVASVGGIDAADWSVLPFTSASCEKSICFKPLGPKAKLSFKVEKKRPKSRQQGWLLFVRTVHPP